MVNIVLKKIKLHSLQNILRLLQMLLRFQHNLMSFRRNHQTDPFCSVPINFSPANFLASLEIVRPNSFKHPIQTPKVLPFFPFNRLPLSSD